MMRVCLCSASYIRIKSKHLLEHCNAKSLISPFSSSSNHGAPIGAHRGLAQNRALRGGSTTVTIVPYAFKTHVVGVPVQGHAL